MQSQYTTITVTGPVVLMNLVKLLVKNCNGPYPLESIVRFWSKVAKGSDCWEWQGALDRCGYGKLQIENRWKKASRVSYELHFGPIPNHLCVCHHCDNRRCVRPEHLFLGTRTENMADMVRKGRSTQGPKNQPRKVNKLSCKANRGACNGQARLSDAAVLQIRKLREQGQSHQSIADTFSVTRSTISHVLRKATWNHL